MGWTSPPLGSPAYVRRARWAARTSLHERCPRRRARPYRDQVRADAGRAARRHRGVEQTPDAARGPARGARRERPPGHPVALGELRVRAPRAPVGELDGPEELLLEPVGAVLVELLVGLAEARERDPD